MRSFFASLICIAACDAARCLSTSRADDMCFTARSRCSLLAACSRIASSAIRSARSRRPSATCAATLRPGGGDPNPSLAPELARANAASAESPIERSASESVR